MSDFRTQQEFRKGSYKKNPYEDPTYLSFAFLFDFYDLVTFDCDIDILLEGRFYELKITYDNGFNELVVYKDRLFSTNQPINNYSVNAGAYNTLNTYNNDYIVL